MSYNRRMLMCTPPRFYVPKRYIIVSLTCLGMAIAHAMRVNVAVTVVTILGGGPEGEPEKTVGTLEALATLPNVEWDANMIGFLHSVFYIGYCTTQIPGGYLATRMPPNRLFGLSVLISCSLNMLLPLCISRLGYVATCIVRASQGVAEGFLFPGSYGVMRYWTMPHERGRMGALVLTGVYVGPVLGLPISGYLTHYFGWQYIYYWKGGIGLAWVLIWLYFSYERPATHPTISDDELKLIQEKQGSAAVVSKDEVIPWGKILTSAPVNALNVCNFARSFVFFLLLTNEPAYLATFGFTVAEIGIYSAIPHIFMTLSAILSGPLADHLWTNPMLTTTDIRKLFTFLGFGVQALCLFCLYYIYDGTQALIFLSLGIGISGLTVSGWHINHLDLAPRYASVMVGLTTASGTLAGIITPVIVGAMTVDQSTENWQNVLLLTASVLAAATVFYLYFGSAEKQPWAEPGENPETHLITKDDPSVTEPYTKVPASFDVGSFSTLLKKDKEEMNALHAGNPESGYGSMSRAPDGASNGSDIEEIDTSSYNMAYEDEDARMRKEMTGRMLSK